jgi:hypothetical protein
MRSSAIEVAASTTCFIVSPIRAVLIVVCGTCHIVEHPSSRSR